LLLKQAEAQGAELIRFNAAYRAGCALAALFKFFYPLFVGLVCHILRVFRRGLALRENRPFSVK